MTAHNRPDPGMERPGLRQPLLVLLISVIITGAAGLWGVYAAPESFRAPLAWGVGTAALLCCTVGTIAAYLHQKNLALHQQIAAQRAEANALADQTIPDLVSRLRRGESANTALASTTLPDTPAYRSVAENLAREVGRGETSRSAAMAACANAAGRMQALSTSMLADLREMEHRHTNEEVLGDLLHLDHRTAQAGRIADSVAVLTGARSGRRWAKPIVMESVLRGAMGRIAGYRRVRLHSASTVSVAGHAAEGVMHALAELLDNATSFSPPTAEVHVYVEEVAAGLIVTVEDSGLVMGEVALRRAERAVSSEPLDLTSLSGTRLGLAVVGRLARKHNLSVSFRPSARGGTGALLMIPQELINRPQDSKRPSRTSPGRTATPVTATPAAAAETSVAPTPTPAAATSTPTPTTPTPAAATPSPSASARPTDAAAAEDAAAPARSSVTPPTGNPSPTKSPTAGATPGSAPRAHWAPTAKDAAPAAPAAPSASGVTGRADTSGSPEPLPARTPPTLPARAPAGTPPTAPTPAAAPTHAEQRGTTPPPPPAEASRPASGLPQRQRGRTLAEAAHRESAPGSRPAPAPRSPRTPAAGFGAFRRAVQGDETSSTPPPASSNSEDDAR